MPPTPECRRATGRVRFFMYSIVYLYVKTLNSGVWHSLAQATRPLLRAMGRPARKRQRAATATGDSASRQRAATAIADSAPSVAAGKLTLASIHGMSQKELQAAAFEAHLRSSVTQSKGKYLVSDLKAALLSISKRPAASAFC